MNFGLKHLSTRLALIALIFVQGAFSQGDFAEVDFDESVAVSPVQLETDHTFYGDVPYDRYEKTKFDLWVPSEARGLIVFIHGGGFRGGDKNSAWNKPSKWGIGPDQIEQILSADLAFASINYRLLDKKNLESKGVIKSLNDSKRALQFLRYHSEEFGFEGSSIALTGTSAGAGTALWLAVNDDMAEPDSDDPISKMSTMVKAVGLRETQSTYDVLRWFSDVFPEGLFPVERISGTALERRILNFYGADRWENLENEKFVAYRRAVDMLDMLDSSDPPVYILNSKDFNPEKGNLVGNLLHSPYHAVALREAFADAGISHQVFIPSEGSKPNQSVADFLIEQLK